MTAREIIAALLVAVGSACEGGNAAQANTTQQAAATTNVGMQISASRRTAITEAVEKVSPAVVTVQTETVERVPADVFEQFFGGRSGQQVSPGIGSGFLIRTDGVIVTNAHVVSGASKVSVMLRDGTTYPATVLGSDETNDVAVLRIKARALPVVALGNSEELLIGEWAIAIGNPFGFVIGNSEPSVTAGVISATGRNLLGRSEGTGVYVGMIQTDAAINPGNSGGPLVNANGEVIGVNSSIYSPSGGSIGLGFAIPINRARRIADDLLEHGSVRRPWIGEQLRVGTSDNPRDVVTAGVILRSVVPGSPAEKAGLQPNDQIVRARGKSLRNVFDWEAERLDMRVGESVPLVVRRGGKDITVSVTVADLPEVSAPRVTVLRELELITLTSAIRADRGLRSERGALVVRASERIQNEIGLQDGDLITQINRVPVAQAADVARAFEAYAGRTGVRLVFERRGYFYSTDFVIQ
ncbi:MAG: trypsin-like peptidase domain-containing protein [Gemmatimonadaceae bacterium]